MENQKVIYHHLNARLLETKLLECIKLQKILNSQGIMIYQLDLGEVFFSSWGQVYKIHAELPSLIEANLSSIEKE